MKIALRMLVEMIVFIPFLFIYIYILTLLFTYNPDVFLYKWMDYFAMTALLTVMYYYLDIVQNNISKSILTFLNLNR